MKVPPNAIPLEAAVRREHDAHTREDSGDEHVEEIHVFTLTLDLPAVHVSAMKLVQIAGDPRKDIRRAPVITKRVLPDMEN